jgi:hypothetical protein
LRTALGVAAWIADTEKTQKTQQVEENTVLATTYARL